MTPMAYLDLVWPQECAVAHGALKVPLALQTENGNDKRTKRRNITQKAKVGRECLLCTVHCWFTKS